MVTRSRPGGPGGPERLSPRAVWLRQVKPGDKAAVYRDLEACSVGTVLEVEPDVAVHVLFVGPDGRERTERFPMYGESRARSGLYGIRKPTAARAHACFEAATTGQRRRENGMAELHAAARFLAATARQSDDVTDDVLDAVGRMRAALLRMGLGGDL